MCLCYQAGSCWCYRRYVVQVVQHKVRHRALALEGPFCSALTSRRHMWHCTRSRVTSRSTDTPLVRDTEDTDEKKNLTGIIKDVFRNFNISQLLLWAPVPCRTWTCWHIAALRLLGVGAGRAALRVLAKTRPCPLAPAA